MRILISNLNRFTTASQLINLLIPFGLVSSAKIMNARNGYSEGMALVEMDYNGGLIVISELNNSRFMNYFIRVEETVQVKIADKFKD